MSIFNTDIIQDESDIIRRKIYEDMILATTLEIGKKTKHYKTNYIVSSTKVIKNFDKVFILNSNFI